MCEGREAQQLRLLRPQREDAVDEGAVVGVAGGGAGDEGPRTREVQQAACLAHA